MYDEPNPVVLKKVMSHLDRHTSGFLGAARFVVITLQEPNGRLVPFFAGGEGGFVRVIDSNCVEFEVPRAALNGGHSSRLPDGSWACGMLFVVPGVKEVVRLKGRAQFWALDAAGETLRVSHRIDQCFFHCAKALMRSGIWDPPKPPPRWKGPRSFTCVRKERESAVITSFYLVPSDGGVLPWFKPGQHVPVEIALPGQEEPVRRAYSLSNRPGEKALRISVKREADPALASGFLHDHVDVGSTVQLRHPAGQFFLDDASQRPVVLLSAGVGLTPMVSMLEHLATTGAQRRVWFFHAAISGREHAMGKHVREIAEGFPNAQIHIAYERPRAGIDLQGQHYESEGRLTVDVLKSRLPWDDYEFYICGPKPFMQGIIEGLVAHGVRPDRIRWEAFSGDKPQFAALDAARVVAAAVPETSESLKATVEFRRSGIVAEWGSGFKSILDLAERSGVPVRSSCRNGECFTCATRVVSGEVRYTHELEDVPDDGLALICTAVPSTSLILDL
ncbi:2Fe-2S iron-sulfur cluster-binding protein [Methylorubrum rhodesianum]|uniref:2Fe-2S iron-sulfur cluster-binding protein n=1 Tax=Methylorubrum rhodesianum TaxID=29427 RepID=UPI003D038DD1